jgi:hypothetical protein
MDTKFRKKGWTIEEDYGGLTHAIMKKGGKRRRTRRTRRKSRKSRKL